ncbi:MAG: cobalamin-dependent protein, partial [Nitrospirota bacterium]|nr:cobalamin-dependent protein [Nitrospirota bacterium]
MKTLLLNPPSFEGFDGGASARYQATREVRSFWYPVWLAYPAGLIKDSRLLDGPAQGVSPEETIKISGDYEFVVIFTSTAGFKNDSKLAEGMKANKPTIKIAMVGPHVTVQTEESLKACRALDFVCRREFDYSVAEFAWGHKLETIAGISYWKDGKIVHNPDRPAIEDLDALPFATD